MKISPGIDDELRQLARALKRTPKLAQAWRDLVPLLERAATQIDFADDAVRNWRARMDGVPIESDLYQITLEMDALIGRGRR